MEFFRKLFQLCGMFNDFLCSLAEFCMFSLFSQQHSTTQKKHALHYEEDDDYSSNYEDIYYYLKGNFSRMLPLVTISFKIFLF